MIIYELVLLLPFILSLCSAQSIYYITPTPDTPCPVDSCLSFVEHTRQGGGHLENATLVFLPGTHTIESSIEIGNLTSLTLRGNFSSLPQVTSRIVCGQPASVSFQCIENLFITSLGIASCGSEDYGFGFDYYGYRAAVCGSEYGFQLQGAAVGAKSVQNLTISNCLFQNNTNRAYCGMGGGVYIRNSTAIFTANQFENNQADYEGGGVYIQNSVANFTGNHFKNNQADYEGGGVYIQNSDAYFTENNFTNNQADYAGGGVYIENSVANFTENQFKNNQANAYGGGVALYTNSVGCFTENVFMNNVAKYEGGGVDVYKNSTAKFLYNNLVKNTAANVGGAVYDDYQSSVEFKGNTFIDNSAMKGGGVAIEYNSTADFTDNSFINNSNSDTWEVEIDATSTATFTNNTFTGYAVYGSTNSTPSVYYVRPSSPDTQCPESPCHTLTEYLSRANQYFTLNTTLVFLRGNHMLEDKLLVSDISALTLTIDGDSLRSVSVNTTNITCTSRLAFFRFQNITEVNINAVGFVSCGNSNSSAISLLALHHASISDCIVQNSTGGALDVRETDTLELTRSSIIDNFSTFAGGIHVVSVNHITFTSNTFIGNFASGSGGAIDMLSSNAIFKGNTAFLRNSANESGGAVSIIDSTVRFSGTTQFTTNSAALGGAITIVNSTVSYHGDTIFISNTAITGGGIQVKDSYLTFQQNTVFQNNCAVNGGAVYAISSKLSFCKNSTFLTNSATYGGAVYAVQCRLNFEGETIFTENTASRDGGGLLLTSDSKYYLHRNATISFASNTAMLNGGAIKVDGSNQCVDISLTSTLNECFFQLSSTPSIQDYQELKKFNVSMNFNNNTAGKGGSDIYGGAVDKCHLWNVDTKCCDFKSSGNVLDNITSETLHGVSSHPLHICICENNEPKCNVPFIPKQVYPGERFIVSVIALGQRNGSVSATIEAVSNITFDSLQHTQKINNTCSKIEYTVFSSEEQTQDITLYAQGPCPREELRSLKLRVRVLPCPLGFQLLANGSKCVCSNRLETYTHTCSIESETILHPRGASFWVGYSNESGGLILHPHCPFDYCISEELYVSVNNSDMQCNYNRTGILCGECIQDLSLVLGSSRCLQCSNSHLTLLIAFSFAGIALVFFLFLLKLTVAVGTINGLIFYANVVQVNSAVFFPPSPSGAARILTVFIAWLNLDLGIETCFYDGMDAYAKTWLQFLFPVYVWILVGIIILFSHFSQMISSLLGKNPIAVLCTLFLLSYAKVLRTIIAVLSFTTLEYPDSHQTVWLFNGNIKYLTGGHIPLFLVALSALLFLFLPFSLLLFCGQWLQGMSNSRVFSWINKPSIKSFLDAYHAPYTGKHRYWTGFLLLTRFGLFLIFAFNALRDPDVNLFCIATVTLLIIMIGFVAERMYVNRYLGALEGSFIINLGILAAATNSKFAKDKDNQAALTYTSVSIAFATFIGIVVYHSYLQLKDYELLKKIANLTLDTFHRRKKCNLNVEDIEKELTTSTQSVVSLREPLLEDEF